MNNTDKVIGYLQIWVIPFAIGAAINFLDAWLWIPLTFLLVLQWVGVVKLLGGVRLNDTR